jgi:tRNA dimethylallyltransferase
MALEALAEAKRRELTPIIVGGTGLYFKALENGLAAIPEIPPSIRETTISLYQELGHDAFRKALAALDPQAATRIEQNDSQRLIRAYEVVHYTGKPLSAWQEKTQQTNSLAVHYDITRHILTPSRDELYARCDRRFLTMIERGALEEVKALSAQNLDPTLPAMKILGARELAAYLRGECSLDEATAKAQQHTRNYAKRQMTWFRNQLL